MKKLYRNLLISSTLLASGVVVGSAIAYKVTHQYKPAFYNFKSYMSEDNQTILRKHFTYTQFSEVGEFNNALINHKAAAGVGTDFLAAQLVTKGLIGKIDYATLFKDESLRDNPTKTKNIVRLFLRDEIWNHLASYNEYLAKYNKGELWEYFFPYYSQDTVIAYNTRKNPIAESRREDKEDPLSGISTSWIKQQNFANGEAYNSFINVLKAVSWNGFDTYVITDAMRDNMLYGSSYWLLPDGERTSSRFTGDVNSDTYKILIDSFKQLIKDGTGYDVRNNRHISFEGDGLELLNQLINPKRPDIKAAIMYNGDAIDAYYGSDNYPATEWEKNNGFTHDGDIRVIKPKQNLLLVDGIMLSASNSEEENKQYIDILSNSVYSNLNRYWELGKDKVNLESYSKEEKAKFNENLVALTWKQIQQEGAFNQLWDPKFLSKDISQVQINNVITKYSDLINLSLPANAKWLEEYNKAQTKEDNEIENYDDKINIAPSILQKYFLANLSTLLDRFLEFTNNQNASVLDIKGDQEAQILSAIVQSNKSEIKSFLSDNESEELKDVLALYLARKIAFIDISNEENIEGWGNLTNFNYINYVPTQEIDYQLVLRNYFADVIDGQDKNVIDIYKISDISSNYDKLEIFVKELQILINQYEQKTNNTHEIAEYLIQAKEKLAEINQALVKNQESELDDLINNIEKEKNNVIIAKAWKNNGIIEHKALSPVSEQISSESSQYYFMETKS
ncbi:type 2 periplasmic-binding domain-containing protein [Mycoplasma sp. Z244C]